ncbi:terminase small subunit [Glaesserella parasuis]|uniref:Terminase n=4 Tax=Glaesserella parasuis TaxID=738 RepID=A0A836YZE7_GLAPU|nr:terminase small subunit [Glaesserella parasuis]AIK16555.1 terminase [Glaesserella parasuis]KDB44194.1 terminase [Glaesserella parasuis HPS9]MCT8848206.1 terminase small subunit [Glaesserella parasuis]MCT8850294.1 terminase small subunit [Glaesserella parasuis]MDG6247124.1 terminase small subunit [Glaesserella parasuis]
MTKKDEGKSTSKGRGLTPKQEKFCQLYIELGNASEAYRQAYDCSKMSNETINTKAKELLKNGPITVRLDELRSSHQQRHNITVDNLLGKLERIYNEAMERDTPQFSSAVNAVMGQAKLLGFDKQVIDHTNSDGSLRPTVIELVAPNENTA